MPTIILTRSEEETKRWRARMPKGFTLLTVPLVNYVPFDNVPLPDLTSFRWIIFTSRRGVDYFLQRVGREGIEGKKIACVGKKSAGSLPFSPQVIASSGEELARDLIERLDPGESILYPGSAEARPELPALLRREGHHVELLPLYAPRTLPSKEALIQALAKADAILFFAPSQVRAALTLLPSPQPLERVKIIAIGRTTAAAFPENLDVTTLGDYTPEALIELIEGGLHEDR